MKDAPDIRRRRLASGMTQAELAARAGVSRQLVAAVEAGRHAPAVGAAIGLARALGTSVEDLFGRSDACVEMVSGGDCPEGAPVRVGDVGGRLVAAELTDHGVAGAMWAKPDGVVEQGRVRLLDGAVPAGMVVAGCDPALGIAETMLAGLGPRSLLAVPSSTGLSLAALEDERVHAAVVHGPASDLPVPPARAVRLHFARWQVGLGVSPRRHAHSLEDILHSDGPLVRRESTAASQQALERAARSAGIRHLAAGPRASSHLDAARRADIMGAAAVTFEAGARVFGLDFLPLEEHTVEVWILERWLGSPAGTALCDLLTTSAFRRRVGLFGGYDLAGCGDLVEAA